MQPTANMQAAQQHAAWLEVQKWAVCRAYRHTACPRWRSCACARWSPC